MKQKILIIGPWISGHMQQWLGDDTSYDYLILTCHKVKPNQEKSNVQCYYFINQIVSFFLFPFFLLTNYLKFKPDIIHVHFLSSYGLLSCFLPKKKLLSIWGSDFNAKVKKNRVLKLIYTLVLNRYDYINSPGNHITEDLISLSIPKNKILTLQYGIDTKLIDKHSFSKEKKLGKIIFSSIRNWDNIYQIDRLISIWNKLNLPNCELWIFGKSENKACENLIRKMSNESFNIKLIGFLPHSELYSKLSLTDVFISIPRMDGTPLSVIECCYLELLPIVTNTPFYTNNINTISKCCIPIDFTENDLSEAIISIINSSRDEVEHIKVTNKNIALSNFDLFKNRKIILDVYKKLLCMNH